MSRPTSDDPVKETAATPGWSTSGLAVSAPPSTTWNTSAGRNGPMISLSSSAVAAAALDGFSSVALP